MQIEFSLDGVMKWQRVEPPLWWPQAQRFIVADRTLPDGTRQHMVPGSVSAPLIVSNAEVLGAEDFPSAEFSSVASPLSQRAADDS